MVRVAVLTQCVRPRPTTGGLPTDAGEAPGSSLARASLAVVGVVMVVAVLFTVISLLRYNT